MRSPVRIHLSFVVVTVTIFLFAGCATTHTDLDGTSGGIGTTRSRKRERQKSSAVLNFGVGFREALFACVNVDATNRVPTSSRKFDGGFRGNLLALAPNRERTVCAAALKTSRNYEVATLPPLEFVGRATLRIDPAFPSAAAQSSSQRCNAGC
jgi:hypothetical protein